MSHALTSFDALRPSAREIAGPQGRSNKARFRRARRLKGDAVMRYSNARIFTPKWPVRLAQLAAVDSFKIVL